VQNADGVVGSALEVLEIAGVLGLPGELFTPRERAYAAGKSDPERRLAARLAAKRAVARLLGVGAEDIEVLAGRGGPPRLQLSPRAQQRLEAQGASRTLLSLTHGRTHAAAAVLLLRP
jgi:holo-[acyl-carrier protein] synthase